MAHTRTGLPRGSDSQFGFGVEAAYGTGVTIASFLETTNTSVVPKYDLVPATGFKSGLRGVRNDRRTVWPRGGDGTFAIEVPFNGALKLWRWAFGGAGTITQQGGTTAWLATFIPGAMTVANGASLTLQSGLPTALAVVEPLTFNGCFCTDWSASCGQGASLDASFTVDSQNFTHATDLATASYVASQLVDWTDNINVKVGGTTLPGVRGITLNVSNGLKIDRDIADGTGKRQIPLEATPRTCQLQLDCEWTDITKTLDPWIADTAQTWIVEFLGPQISGSYYYTWRITIQDGRITGAPPQVDNADVLNQTVTIDGLDDGTNPQYKLEVMCTDVSI